MATTTNYGWTTPDNTDLVKDGAAAIRTLGSAIDTSMNTALGTKKAGLVLLNTTSFSGVASQAVDSIFTSSYRNYRILINLTSNSATQAMTFNLRASGVTNTANQYYYATIRTLTSSATIANYDRGNPTSYFLIGETVTTNTHSGELYLSNPQTTDRTQMHVFWEYPNQFYWTSGSQDELLSFDGFILTPSTGTITGSVSIYGFNK